LFALEGAYLWNIPFDDKLAQCHVLLSRLEHSPEWFARMVGVFSRRPCAAHSITSSARTSSIGEISRPSALAVLRLMTSSSLVGNSMGKSATGVPSIILYNIGCGATKTVLKINSVANEPARFHMFAVSINGRKAICRCGSGDVCPIQN